MLTPEAFKPLREVGSQFHASANGVAASAQVFDILEEPLPSVPGTSAAPDLRTTPIVISNLSVKAPGRATIAPASLSATIAPGSITVLRGPVRFGKVDDGVRPPPPARTHLRTVTVGDQRARLYRAGSSMGSITWVPQRPAIVPGTVLENLGVGGEPTPELLGPLLSPDSTASSPL